MGYKKSVKQLINCGVNSNVAKVLSDRYKFLYLPIDYRDCVVMQDNDQIYIMDLQLKNFSHKAVLYPKQTVSLEVWREYCDRVNDSHPAIVNEFWPVERIAAGDIQTFHNPTVDYFYGIPLG